MNPKTTDENNATATAKSDLQRDQNKNKKLQVKIIIITCCVIVALTPIIEAWSTVNFLVTRDLESRFLRCWHGIAILAWMALASLYNRLGKRANFFFRVAFIASLIVFAVSILAPLFVQR